MATAKVVTFFSMFLLSLNLGSHVEMPGILEPKTRRAIYGVSR